MDNHAPKIKWFLLRQRSRWECGGIPERNSELSRCLVIWGIPSKNFSSQAKEFGNFPMPKNLGNSLGKFPKKRNQGTSQIPFGNLRGYIFKIQDITLHMGIWGISPGNLGTFQMSGNLVNSLGRFPQKRNLETFQIFFGNLRGFI